MGPTVEQQRNSTQTEQSQDRGFEHLAAPLLHRGLEMVTFSPELAAWKLLFKLAPDICKGMSSANGEYLPNEMNVFALSAVAGLRDLITRGGSNLRAA
jgi:hypothetical protein